MTPERDQQIMNLLKSHDQIINDILQCYCNLLLKLESRRALAKLRLTGDTLLHLDKEY